MKQILLTIGVFFTLGALVDAAAVEISADDAPAIHVAIQPQPDVIAEDDAATNISSETPITQVPYRSSFEFRHTAKPRSDLVYRDFLARFSVSEIMKNKTSPTMRLTLNSRVGVQWSLDGQRPSLEYRLSGSAVIRLRGSRHSPRLVMHSTF